MTRGPTFLFKLSYCLVVLGAVVPFGLAKSSWVGMAMGGGLFALPLIGPIFFLILGLYRIYLVARRGGTLSSPAVPGLLAVLQSIGRFCIYVGACVTIAGWLAGPLMHLFMTRRTESGAEFFVVGIYLALVGGVGVLGLLLFEFSRLVAFERNAGASPSGPAPQRTVSGNAGSSA
ncbi:MAG: hypothetical protein ABI809_09300 [Caldimonas sp.]